MNIINSDMVSPVYDVFWDEVSSVVKDAGPRNILILVNTFAPGGNEELQLRKMLDACKLPPEEYNIIQLESGRQVAWHQLRERLDPKVVFLIGILPAQLGISSLFMLNAPNRFNDRIWLATLSLAELEQNAEAKKQLWVNGMKPIFVDGLLHK